MYQATANLNFKELVPKKDILHPQCNLDINNKKINKKTTFWKFKNTPPKISRIKEEIIET